MGWGEDRPPSQALEPPVTRGTPVEDRPPYQDALGIGATPIADQGRLRSVCIRGTPIEDRPPSQAALAIGATPIEDRGRQRGVCIRGTPIEDRPPQDAFVLPLSGKRGVG